MLFTPNARLSRAVAANAGWYTMPDVTAAYGTPWEVGLSRFRTSLERPWTLTVLPLRSDSPIYIQEEVKPTIKDGQVANVSDVRIIPEYELRLAIAQ